MNCGLERRLVFGYGSIDGLFTEVTMRSGVIKKVGTVSVEDTKLKANASRHSKQKTCLAGLIQAAIDRSNLNAAFESTRTLNASDLNTFPEPGNIEQASGGRAGGMSAAAHINQADVLQGIGSFIQVRSDTFRIRSYGNARDPLTGEVRSQVWCEMLVQRLPEPVYPTGNDAASDPDYWVPDPTQGDFGRRFEVISIRFLDEESV